MTTAGRKDNAPQARRWGLIASLTWGFLGFILFLVGHIVAIIALLIPNALPGATAAEIELLANEITRSGSALSLGFLISLPLMIGFVAFVASRRSSPREYLGLSCVSARTYAPWVLGLFGFQATIALMDVVFGYPHVPEFMTHAYQTTSSPFALFVAVALAAPLAEELLYRGLVLPGLASTRLGPSGAVVLLSTLWALSHAQYQAYEMAQIFVLGLLFGAARLRTGSLAPTFVMHVAVNAVAFGLLLCDGAAA